MDAVTSEWNGFKRLDFQFQGRNCILIFPKKRVKKTNGYIKPNILVRFLIWK